MPMCMIDLKYRYVNIGELTDITLVDSNKDLGESIDNKLNNQPRSLSVDQLVSRLKLKYFYLHFQNGLPSPLPKFTSEGGKSEQPN